MSDSRVPAAQPAAEGAVSDPRPSAPSTSPSAWGRTFAALQYPNYRLWFTGQLVSLVGTWMQTTAQGFLVFELTRSPAYLGYVGFAAGAPSLLLMLFGGVIADRVPRRNLLVITQTTMMVLAFILAGLTFTKVVQPWHIILLALALGTANAFDAPAGQAFVLELVDRKSLTNAIALNGSLGNLATVVGPTVAGLTYAAFGAAWCFTLNGVSFIAVIVALLLMRLPPRPLTAAAQSPLAQLKEGLRYLLAHPLLRTLLAAPAVAVLFVAIYGILLPAWAVEVLHGDATVNGLLQSARGAGSLIGALLIASLAHLGQRGRWLTLGTFWYPALILVFALTRTLPLSMAALVGVGLGGMMVYNMANALVQSQVSDEFRGRVMSVYSLIMFGGMPLGSLWAGTAAHFLGAPLTLTLGAGVALACAAAFWFLAPQLRRLS
ncbi:MAG: MFS transporter [Anaerolineae bacterium]|nr:MFS transporter [Anaerolineae bacterium]